MYEIIKKFEAFRSEPYLCAAGKPTIGYGSTIYDNGAEVTLDDPPISEMFAAHLLDHHIEKNVKPAIKTHVKAPLNINQKDALISLIYNIGSEAFRKSTLLKRLNEYDYEGAAYQFCKWRRAGRKILTGLIERRALEMILFLRPPYKSELKPRVNISEENENVFVNLANWLISLFQKKEK